MAIYSVNEVIEMAVQIERSGYAFYNEAVKRKEVGAYIFRGAYATIAIIVSPYGL